MCVCSTQRISGPQPVQRAVDAPGGRIRRVGALHDGRIVDVEQEQVAGLDAGEMPPAGVDQDAPALGVEGEAEMVGDRLVPAEARRQPERRRQIDARLPLAPLHLVTCHRPLALAMHPSARIEEAAAGAKEWRWRRSPTS